MRKIFFAIICSFIALGWVGCDNKGTYLDDPSPRFYVYIDSTLTACGMDSFLIKSSWMQERINTFINTANINAYPPEVLLIHHFLDKDSVDYFIEGATGGSSPGRLYDCEGNFIEEKAPWSLLLDERDVAFNAFVVDIEIGMY